MFICYSNTKQTQSSTTYEYRTTKAYITSMNITTMQEIDN